jgi:hypothetical protein
MPAIFAGAVMNRNPGVAEHATTFEGVITTFTKIDKANGSAEARAAGTVTRKQKTPLYLESSDIGCRRSIVPTCCWTCSSVSTVFRVEGNYAIPDMTKRGIINSNRTALVCQIFDITRSARHV